MAIKSERGVYGYFVILLLIIVFLVFLYLSTWERLSSFPSCIKFR